MKAAVYERTGPAGEVLRVEDVDTPEPGPGEVRVRISASGVNPTDWKARSGLTPVAIDGFQVPNQDGAGVIDAVGDGVDAARVGQRVWLVFAAFQNRWGTAAEYSVLKAERAVALPAGASFELGASLGIPAVTAAYCLGDRGRLSGATVLVAGGAGAVGHYAIELAKHAGARVVTTVSSAEKAELARTAGADLVVNYRDRDVVDQVKAYAPTVDRVVEVDLGANLDLDLALSAPNTVITTYAATPQDPALPVRRLMTANVTLRFVLLYLVPPAELAAAVGRVADAVRDGALSELPVTRFGLDQVADAHDAVEGGAVGKVLVVP
ncbi:MAG: NADPH:quinone reductase [Streptosporangiales bacterium]|nr:NADPH:quinone reductase [Streptosporangiales bacterium]MBO0890189.1 NADPH:quinone reductase [Acidothermales bacterium]